MSKKDVLDYDPITDEKPIWYNIVKYVTFMAPAIIIVLTLFYFTRDLIISIVGTAAILFIGVVAIALWWIRTHEV